MQTGPYNIHSPMILGGDMSEAEAFGAAVWLWMHSAAHRDLPLHALPTVLLPIIKRQQYALVSRDARPLFFLSWMWLDDVAERRYLKQPAISVQDRDWASGERMWIRDWIAPFGDTMAMRRLVGNTLFPECCFRALYHRGAEKGQRVINFKGDRISHQQARAWRAAHPLSVPVTEMPVRTLS
ncbi:toxin-activating lysine-acyltransferase [Erwinia sp. ACCC 02193]|uniref:RTX toxin-activating lysine-acyltransferase n=1 Tax=Erwinia aeris TaxID=3239803 RepID=A0ABV4EBQ0_9GAMM